MVKDLGRDTDLNASSMIEGLIQEIQTDVTLADVRTSINKLGATNLVHYYLGTAAVIDWTIKPKYPFRLESIDVHTSAILDTSEVLTITKDARNGTSFDAVLLSEDLFIGSRTSYHAVFGEGYEFVAGDELDIAQLNGSADTIGIDVTIKPL